ncbi:HET-domain-containing protein [Fusarium austroafricanum]|uniref:HET-domain-containing protein n=1 Tax=Fusarium austroafricanum TaxID=2364996 RepID=A0A8H4JUJ9_9HYPO|nr:HET-domain-containing protein [Fusarium austroafricanum]
MASLYNRFPSIIPLPGYYNIKTPTEYNVDFGWRCCNYATIAICFTILGYLLDLLPWDFIRHTAIFVYSTFNVIAAPDAYLRFKTACLHAIAAIVAILLHRWYELLWAVSTYLAITFCGCWLDIELVYRLVLDCPTDKVGEYRRLNHVRMFAHVSTAALLFRRKEVFHLMFSNIKNCDPVSTVVLPPLLSEFIYELNSRRPNMGISWKSMSESFAAIQQILKPLDNFYFELRSRVYYYLKIKYRNWMEERDQQVNALKFDYSCVPIKEDEIRLLYLPRRSWNPLSGGLIRTKLFSVPLAEVKDYEYEALSYTWGQTSTQRTIAIWDRRFYISQNLHRLLYARRSLFHDRFLWVDQICINQKNDEEIESQIEKMRDIYIDADRVVAWLDDSFDATMAVHTIAKISNQFQLWNIQSDKLLNSWDRNTPQWRAFMKFILHRYFTRAWICQEAGLGHNLQFYIGGFYLLPETIWYAMRALSQSDAVLEICKESDIPANHALDVIKCWNTTFGLRPWDSESSHNKETTHCLGLMLSVCSKLQATDPRDKIYALLGISNSDIGRQIKASQNISKSELFRSTAIKLLESTNDAEFVLPHAGIYGSNNNPDLPTWAPDWEMEIQRTTELISIHLPPGMQNIQRMITMSHEVEDLPNTLTCRYTAGGLSRPEFQIDRTLGWLRTNGVLIDRITTQTTRTYDYLSMDLLSVQLWLAEAEMLAHEIPDRAVLPRTLIGNRINSNLSWRPDPESLLKAYHILKDDLAAFEVESLRYRNYGFMEGSQSATEAEGQGNDLVLTMDFASRMKAICGGRKLCATARQRLGVVPAMTRKDDVVYIIPGMQTPYILRPVSIPIIGGSVGWFKLVGECYIDGAMDAHGIYLVILPPNC